jgi:hypothetical protein
MTEQSNIRMLTINEAAVRVPGLTKYRIREICSPLREIGA